MKVNDGNSPPTDLSRSQAEHRNKQSKTSFLQGRRAHLAPRIHPRQDSSGSEAEATTGSKKLTQRVIQQTKHNAPESDRIPPSARSANFSDSESDGLSRKASLQSTERSESIRQTKPTSQAIFQALNVEGLVEVEPGVFLDSSETLTAEHDNTAFEQTRSTTITTQPEDSMESIPISGRETSNSSTDIAVGAERIKDIRNAIKAAASDRTSTPTVQINIHSASENSNAQASGQQGKQSLTHRVLQSALNAMLPTLAKNATTVAQSAKHLGKSIANSQLLVIAQPALERKPESSFTSSKFALPHLVLLYKFDEPEKLLLFALARHQVSIGADLPFASLSAGAFAADETGFVWGLELSKPIVPNPDFEGFEAASPSGNDDEDEISSNAESKSDVASSAETKSSAAREATSGHDPEKEFIQLDKYKINLKSTNVLTHMHLQSGMARTWDDSTHVNSTSATSMGGEVFKGQTYEWGDASRARKASVVARILTENIVGAACGLCARATLGPQIGITNGIDSFDSSHAYGMAAKHFARRALDVVVPPTARTASSSTTLDPGDFNRVGGRVNLGKPAGATIFGNVNIYTKLQWRHGGTVDNVTKVWASKLQAELDKTSLKTDLLTSKIAELTDTSERKDLRVQSLVIEGNKVNESIDQVINDLVEMETVNQQDRADASALSGNIELLEKGIEATNLLLTTINAELEELDDTPEFATQKNALRSDLATNHTRLNDFENQITDHKIHLSYLTEKITKSDESIEHLSGVATTLQRQLNVVLEQSAETGLSGKVDSNHAQRLKTELEETKAEIKPFKDESDRIGLRQRKNAYQKEIESAKPKAKEESNQEQIRKSIIDETNRRIDHLKTD